MLFNFQKKTFTMLLLMTS